MSDSFRHAPLAGTVIIAGLIAFLGIGAAALTYGVLLPLHAQGGALNANDIDAFLAAGHLVREGQGHRVHDPQAILAALRHFVETDRPIIWNYPPHATLITALATMMQTRASMRIFIEAATLAAALGLAWRITRRFPPDRLARAGAAACIIMGTPMVMTMLTAQPAWLIGMAGIGSVLLAQGGRRFLPALLVILTGMKPHIALPFYALLYWRAPSMRPVILLGIAGAVLLTAVAEIVLGFGATWRFMAAARDAAAGVTGGSHYIQERLLPASTWLRNWLPAGLAGAAHAAIMLPAFAAIAWAARKTIAPQRILALAGVATLWLSPYLYDYDMGLAVACCVVMAGACAVGARAATAWIMVATLVGMTGLGVKIMQPAMDLSLLRGLNMLAPFMLTALAIWPGDRIFAPGCDGADAAVNTHPFDFAKK